MEHNTSDLLFLVVTITAYLGGSGLLIHRLFFQGQGRGLRHGLALGVGTLAVLSHAVLLHKAVVFGAGLNVGFTSTVSLTCWIIALILLVSSLNKPIENLGIVLFPLAALAVFLAWRFPHVRLMVDGASWGLKGHVLVSMLSYSLLTLASVQAILLAIQDQHLHSRHPGGFVRGLPPLQTMEALLFELIAVGFVLLSLSLMSGFVFLENMFAQHMAHKTILSVIGWVVFGILLWGRFRHGWRGRTALIWTLSGFGILMLGYFGSKAVLELVLKR
ncbi:MAG: cytochrome c biogenesis protein CcsA [Pseudomonadota bacterium]